MDKKQIAALLDEMGTLFELKGENPFKCRAFHNAARVVEGLTVDIAGLVANGDIRSVKGIGEHLSKLIAELVQTGKCKEYEEIKSSLPDGLLQMIRIPGLGPKRVKMLYDKLKIQSIEGLQKACSEHRLADLEGFGEKTEENILKGIQLLASVSDKHLYPQAKKEAEPIVEALRRLKGVKRCEVAGSLRRRKEIIGDIDILAIAAEKDRAKISEAFVTLPSVQRVIGRGDTKSSVLLGSGIQCDLRVVSGEEYPFALNYFTGSKEHNVEMRSRANSLGLSLNEYGFS
ncbi:MAG TPA: DNA polymerase III, partial [Bacteroidetes bacterium]|nr:DNA polymerase III [Bacteroidota bacterium]